MGWYNAGGWRGQGWADLPAAGGGGGANNIAFNGTAVTGTNGAGNTTLPSLTTTLANCTIVVIAAKNSGAGPATVSSSPALTFTNLVDTSGLNANNIAAYIALAASAGTYTITVTGSGNYTEGIAFAFSGVTSSSPSDGATSVGASPISLTTTNANDVLVVGTRNGSGTGLPGTPWVATATGSFLAAEYQIVTATQSSLSISDSSGTSNGMVAFGLKST